MKKTILFALTSLVCLSTSAETTDLIAVQGATQRLNEAMIAGDAQQMKALTTAALSYGHSNGRVQDQAAFIQTIAGGETRYRRINLSNSVTTVDGDNAIVRDHFSGTTEKAGTVSEVDFDQLMVWQKRDGVWRLLARQGYKH
ncbi:nuclear transport factor 2 family protein [Paraburkholderia sediminicola]|uniref:nuclear transport factor 2 family protein n=1 Tax=Paraburkholderia sediminicola TaxID=458836 RepID=UPI0038B713C5